MTKPKRKLTILPSWKSRAKEVLTQAMKFEYSSVIVLGFKDSNVYTHISSCEDYIRILGALETAKYNLLAKTQFPDEDDA